MSFKLAYEPGVVEMHYEDSCASTGSSYYSESTSNAGPSGGEMHNFERL